MTLPTRIQRKRTKGWKSPPGTIYCGRPSRWGNPFQVVGNAVRPLWHVEAGSVEYTCESKPEAHQTSVDIFRAKLSYIRTAQVYQLESTLEPWFEPMFNLVDNLEQLRNATHLSCWCGLDQPCHVDPIIDLLRETQNG